MSCKRFVELCPEYDCGRPALAHTRVGLRCYQHAAAYSPAPFMRPRSQPKRRRRARQAVR